MTNLINRCRNSIVTVAGTALYGANSVMAQGFIQPGDNPSAVASATGGTGSARELILTIVNFFLGFLGLIAVLMIIYGGVMMVTSGGGESVTKGKKILMYAAIGIVIILLSFAFVNTILGAGTGQSA